MKPLVSVFNAYTWYDISSPALSSRWGLHSGKTPVADKQRRNSIVISTFAIVILSIIGAMFANGNHSMMGSEEDPEDGGAVAASVFGAVIVYAVGLNLHPSLSGLGQVGEESGKEKGSDGWS